MFYALQEGKETDDEVGLDYGRLSAMMIRYGQIKLDREVAIYALEILSL